VIAYDVLRNNSSHGDQQNRFLTVPIYRPLNKKQKIMLWSSSPTRYSASVNGIAKFHYFSGISEILSFFWDIDRNWGIK